MSFTVETYLLALIILATFSLINHMLIFAKFIIHKRKFTSGWLHFREIIKEL